MYKSFGILFCLFALWGGGNSFACDDWYHSTIQCGEMRKKLRADTLQNICGELIALLPSNTRDLNKLQRVSFCLQQVASALKTPYYHSQLRLKLPEDETWFVRALNNYRIHREFSSGMGLAYLAEIKHRSSPAVRPVLNDLYFMSSAYLQAGLSNLQWVNADPRNYKSAQFNLDNIINTIQTSVPASVFLDSLVSGLGGGSMPVFALLKELCFSNGNFHGAFACALGQIKLGGLAWYEIEADLSTFCTQGLYDYADEILQGFRGSGNVPVSIHALPYFYFIKFHLRDWESITAQYRSDSNWHLLPHESAYYLAKALFYHRNNSIKADDTLNYGLEQAALIASSLRENATYPWIFKSAILLVEVNLARGDLKTAKDLIQKEKSNPYRKGGTGTVLFWESVLRLFENEFAKADSLLILSSAYTGEEFCQRALKYRQWLMLDTNSEYRTYFFKGLKESALSVKERIKNLVRVPIISPLWAHSQLEIAGILAENKQFKEAGTILSELIKSGQDQWIVMLAQSKNAFIKETIMPTSQKVLAIYDAILLKYQQGIISEFARERIQYLNQQSLNKGELLN